MSDKDERLLEESGVSESPKPKRGKTGLIAGLLALVLAIGAGGYYCLTHMGGGFLPVFVVFTTAGAPAPTPGPTPEPKEMPDLIYETEAVAEKVLAEVGLKADIIYVPSRKVPAGLVTLQSVSPGQPVELDEELVVYISLGPAPTPTPEPTPLPTPTPKATPRPTPIPVIVAPTPFETPCPTG